LYVGTSNGTNDIYGQSQGTSTSGTVSALPTDGRTLYVRLWSYTGSAWLYRDYTYTAANAGINWEFNSNGNPEGWTPVNMSASSVNGGVLFLDPAGSDPYVAGPTINASASSYRYVILRLASNALDGGGAIYFRTSTSNFYSEDKKVTFTVNYCRLCGNAGWYQYSISMAGNAQWTGTITGIRLDPANSGQGGTNTDSIGVDYIRLVP
jgi:hypothetical protein